MPYWLYWITPSPSKKENMSAAYKKLRKLMFGFERVQENNDLETKLRIRCLLVNDFPYIADGSCHMFICHFEFIFILLDKFGMIISISCDIFRILLTFLSNIFDLNLDINFVAHFLI